jgi:CRISPR system Cascade subunit CasE
LSFLCLSERPPQDPDNIWHIESKSFAPRLNPGDRLLFSLRVNAVRKTRDAAGRQVRHDIVQHARTRLKEEGVPVDEIPPRPILAQQEGKVWFLNRQDAFGLTLHENSFMVEQTSRHTFYKKRSGKGQLTLLDMRGMVLVNDVDRLMHTIKNGIGPAKGFGCGLLLLRRI